MRTFLLLALVASTWAADATDTPESHLDKARALHAAGNDKAALAELYLVETQNPRFAPAWELKGDIFTQQGNTAAARTAYREAARLRPEGEAPRKLEAAGGDLPAHQPWTIGLTGQRDSFTEERGIETEATLRAGYVSRPPGEVSAWGAAGEVTREDRFRHVEHTVALDGFLRVAPRFRLTAGGAYTPAADWNARWQVRGGLLVDLPAHLTLGGELHHRDYPDRQVLRARPSLHWQPCQGFAVSAGLIADTDHVDAVGTAHEQAGYGRIESIWERFTVGVEYQAGTTIEPPQVTENAQRIGVDVTWRADEHWAFTAISTREHREIAGQQTTLGGRIDYRF